MVSGALDATGQFWESEIDLVSGALDATGDLLQLEIDTLEGQTLASLTDIAQQTIDLEQNLANSLIHRTATRERN